MTLVPKGGTLSAFLQAGDGEVQVDFSKISVQEFFKNDIVKVRISGLIPRFPDPFLVNFIESILYEVTAYDVDFSRCDFKDTLIKESNFKHCVFNDSAFATSFFVNCEFEDCTFNNTAIHSSEFHRTEFHLCDLTNTLVKSSRFIECTFDCCSTNNKLMEMSTLDKTTFIRTDIQLQTITGNFGLTLDDISGSGIRSGRTRESFSFLDPLDLQAELQSDGWSAIEKLRIEYFLKPDLTQGSQYLDQALDLTRWTEVYKNPGSFVELLESFSEFMTHLYSCDRLTVHTILLFHNITSQLTDALPQRDDFHRLAMSLGGAHMVLSRIVEEYLGCLDLVLARSTSSISLLVEGPFDRDYYAQALAPWFTPAEMSIDFLIEHNSPLELGVSAGKVAALIPLLAVFLAARTKIEIVKLHERNWGNPSQRGKESPNLLLPSQQTQRRNQLLSISAGLTPDSPRRYEIQVRSLLPGSLLMDLQLQVGTQIIGKLRKIILDLLS
ncbi:MAG TPA: pentapeptide repeat-containing protein [Thermoanaerobaculia bacterium]|nr:pentapeptide repeat-containing protein [Thermoanaerobaculia bacterium]